MTAQERRMNPMRNFEVYENVISYLKETDVMFKILSYSERMCNEIMSKREAKNFYDSIHSYCCSINTIYGQRQYLAGVLASNTIKGLSIKFIEVFIWSSIKYGFINKEQADDILTTVSEGIITYDNSYRIDSILREYNL